MNPKIFAISDTHTKHDKLHIPECDILLHAGDFTGRGSEVEAYMFINWLASLEQVKHKVFIAGNHDFIMEKPEFVRSIDFKKMGINYLMDSSIEIEGIKIYGTPWTPYFYDWAFNGLEDEVGNEYPGGPGISTRPDKDHPHLLNVYSKIDPDADIVMCHGPCYNVLDRTLDGLNVGSKRLWEVVNYNKPYAFVSGHIHEARGIKSVNGVTYHNVSSLNRDYNMTNKLPIQIFV